MKMTKAKKAASIVAVLLAALMVLTIIPAAAFAVDTAADARINGAEVISGQTIDAGYTVAQPYNVTTETINVATGVDTTTQYRKAKLEETTISGVYATDINMGATSSVLQQSSGVSVYPTLTNSNADYSKTVMAALNAAMDNQITSFSSSTKDKLTAVQISASTSTVKTIYLYAYQTKTVRTIDGYSSLTESQTSSYVYLGAVTIYPKSLTLTVNAPSSIACGKTGNIIVTSTSTQVDYQLSTSTLLGFSSISQVQSGIWQLTANSLVTSSSQNKLEVTAYAKSADGKYILYGSDGKLYKSSVSSTASQTYDKTTGLAADGNTLAANKVTVYPIYATKTLYIATTSPITALSFSQSRYDIEVGDTASTSITKTPSGATGSVSYSSTNSSVATVSSSGVITGVGVGTATIVATATDGSGVSAYTSVKVSAQTVSMSIDSSIAALDIGQTRQLKATATILATNTTADATTWYSSNNSVASVSATGLVTAKAAGFATISAFYTNGSVTKTVSCYVTVSAQRVKIEVASDSLSIAKGETGLVDASISDGSKLLYVSENNKIAKVDENGVVTGVAAGSTMITVVSASNIDLKGYCVVTVTEPKGVISVSTKKVSNSKYYWTSSILSADVKAAYDEVKSDGKNVTVEVTSKSSSNKVIFSRYAIARLAKYADSLTVKCGDRVVVYSNAQLKKMASYGRPVYVYITASSSSVKYKNASGVYKKIF